MNIKERRDKLVEGLLGLINSKPRSPTAAELHALLDEHIVVPFKGEEVDLNEASLEQACALLDVHEAVAATDEEIAACADLICAMEEGEKDQKAWEEQELAYKKIFKILPAPADGTFRFDHNHGVEYALNGVWVHPKTYLLQMRERGQGECRTSMTPWRGMDWAYMVYPQGHAWSPGVWYDSPGKAHHVSSCERCGAHEPGCLPELPKMSEEA